MDHKIIDQSAQGRFIVERYGQIPFEKTARLLKEIISHPNWKKDTNLLVDLRKVDFTNYTFEDLEKTTTLQATLKAKIGAGRLAFVMPPKDAYKVEMYKFNTDHQVDVTIKNFAFDEYDKALKWVDTGKE